MSKAPSKMKDSRSVILEEIGQSVRFLCFISRMSKILAEIEVYSRIFDQPTSTKSLVWQTGKATLSFKLMSQDHNRTRGWRFLGGKGRPDHRLLNIVIWAHWPSCQMLTIQIHEEK